MDIGSLSIILIVGLLLLISIGVPMGFASGFMGAVLVFLYIGEHALVWGYGTRWGWANDKVKFFGLSVASAVFVSLMAAPIVIFVFGGATGHSSDILTAGILASGAGMWQSVFSSNIIVSAADKILSSFLALAIIGALPKNLQVTGPIMAQEDMGKAVLITAGTVVGVILTVVSMTLL